MSEQSIESKDMTLKQMLQDFYRVPDYQREYVWEDEVNQFLMDIHEEYQDAAQGGSIASAPEYFIGTIVVCQDRHGVFELIDGQQRATTIYLTLCALRDALAAARGQVFDELKNQIAASSVNADGVSVARRRLELQYADSGGVLKHYAEGSAQPADQADTDSIRKIRAAYACIRDFLSGTLGGDPEQIGKFYGYLTNKVKIIRIQTFTIAKALKIFETINDRGVGLDAMDLLKNLLFMNASSRDFKELKDIWKAIVDQIHASKEKPLRFLRYYIFSNFDVETRYLKEEEIYGWLQKNERKTGHASQPLTFAKRLLEAAKAYRHFTKGENPSGRAESGLINTRRLGGSTVKQHFILLLAGRKLGQTNFSRLCDEIEKTMFVWMMVGFQTKEYELRIIQAARALRALDKAEVGAFVAEHFRRLRADQAANFERRLLTLRARDLRQFRLRYLLAKLTQYVDAQAYGPSSSADPLRDYFANANEIEHIQPQKPKAPALGEFGEGGADSQLIQSLGNLLLVEKSINAALGNKAYSEKSAVYPKSKYLLTRCQASQSGGGQVGVADKITKAAEKIEAFPRWNAEALGMRQKFLTRLAQEVWDAKLAA